MRICPRQIKNLCIKNLNELNFFPFELKARGKTLKNFF